MQSYDNQRVNREREKGTGWAFQGTGCGNGANGGSCATTRTGGIQYCSGEYTKLLRKNGMAISMTQNGDHGENSLAERVNGTIKGEFLQYWFHGNHEAAQ